MTIDPTKKISIAAKYADLVRTMLANSAGKGHIDQASVFQEGNEKTLPLVQKMISDHLLPGSGISGMEHLEELYERAQKGEACLILCEHYSNFDLPLIHYFFQLHSRFGRPMADALVAIAGLKLNEQNPVVLAFAEAYTRLIIYPSRSTKSLQEKRIDEKEIDEELQRSRAINKAAMKKLEELKHQGRLILVFPSGTRYRQGQAETKRGLREIDSYVKSFDVFCFLSIKGVLLSFNEDPDHMEDDMIVEGRVRMRASPIIVCKEYRDRIKAQYESRENLDRKQVVADSIMKELDELHQSLE